MNLTIELSDESAARLKQQAAGQGLSLEAWVQAIAQEKAGGEEGQANQWKSQAAAARILEIQKRVQPDPEGWTVHDYTDRGRLQIAVLPRKQELPLFEARDRPST